jgi:omega-6 fatty acid desaturase (delta-12 desaturase)
METVTANNTADDSTWQKIVLKYARPDLRKSIWQIVNSVLPYIILWILMVKSLEYSYWITLLLSILAGGFMIRIFIIFHDCGHGSFFRSTKVNVIVGKIMGILTFTPYYPWHNQHGAHHATAANLDKRGMGDVWTMTVDEYITSSRWKKLVYRIFRNPFILFTIGPVYVIFIRNRFTVNKMNLQEKKSIWFTNIALLIFTVAISLVTGLKGFLLIQLPILFFSHSVGVWLFYIQHQFDDVSWERQEEWDYKTAAITGCSFLKLPAVFQWFTGNIGYHHVHHLSSRIPNYNLQACHDENGIFDEVRPLVLFSTFGALYLSLWDEPRRQLTSFRRLRAAIRHMA